MTLGKKKNGCMILGNTLDKTLPCVVAEGWAHGVGVFDVFEGNCIVLIAFGKAGLIHIANIAAKDYDDVGISEDKDSAK